jgi:hypothetical protein
MTFSGHQPLVEEEDEEAFLYGEDTSNQQPNTNTTTISSELLSLKWILINTFY